MTRFLLFMTGLLLVGCATTPSEVALLPAPTNSVETTQSASNIALVAYEQPLSPELVQPPSLAEPAELDEQQDLPQQLPPTDGLTLEALQQIALSNNPTISQSMARVRALRGKWEQVGLPPNPTIGYAASEIGNDGAAGQQGGYIGQQFITGKKLQRNRAVVAAEIERAEQQLAAVRRQVQTDTRQSYYAALLAQRRVEVTEELVRVTTEAVDASKSLVKAEEIPLAGLLQTEVQQQNVTILLQTARNEQEQAWRKLSAVVGGPELPVQPLAGDVSQLPGLLDWNEQLARLHMQSPEMAEAIAELQRSRRALSRACVEAVPDINTQLSVQYDNATDDTIAGVQLGIPIPIWNRNQGGIRQAQAEITEASQNIERVERNLSQRLATAFRDYSNARVRVENYASEILPRAQQTMELVQQGYAQGEVGYLDLLTAQQTYSQTNLAYLDALGSLWQNHVLIDGMLLNGSLDRNFR